MLHENFTTQYRTVGRIGVWAIFILGVVYAVITALGLLSLKSPEDPIGEPWSIWEFVGVAWNVGNTNQPLTTSVAGI